MDVHNSARTHIRNLLFNWGGHAAMLLVMFFLSPYIIGKLDAVSYGIWSLLNVLTGYMGLFDLGVRASVGRHVALYLGKGDEKGVDETIRAGLGFFSLTGWLILVAGIILAWLFPQIFRSISAEHHRMVRMLLPLMVVNVWLSALAAIYSSVLAAHDRFDVARSIDIGVLIVRTAGTVWVLHIGWGLWGLVGSVVVGNILAVAGNCICARFHHHGLRSWPLLYSRERLREIVNYGLAAFVSSASVKIIGQTDLIIVGVALSVSDVREYSVGAMIVYYSSTFVTLIGRTFFPVVQRAVAAGRMGEARHFLYRQVRLALCFGLLVYVGFAIYSRSFIRLWMLQDNFDERSVEASALVMTVLAIAQLPLLYTRPSLNLLAAMGYIRFNAGIAIIEALANLGLSLYFVLVMRWGLAGIAAGTLVSRLLVSGIWVPFYLCRRADIPLRRFVFATLLPGIFAAGLFAVFCLCLLWIWLPTTWLALWTHIAVATLCWAVLASVMLLPHDYRQRVIGHLCRLVFGMKVLLKGMCNK
jgi:O-antigen/teichoic acid export membrane protein